LPTWAEKLARLTLTIAKVTIVKDQHIISFGREGGGIGIESHFLYGAKTVRHDNARTLAAGRAGSLIGPARTVEAMRQKADIFSVHDVLGDGKRFSGLCERI
jgi:hypothetical protein